ncbi:hypothetical protein [Glycomyces tritici]|uniref:Uncharacterized protein n=1 Tax=Glycomyces tritici TaxID=2665176 RepID=A0ABT7YIN1_9ACTN|nr:hypothetical protein [Glycomyces tritici]MDN3238471.1 hypothetical protein [Glycomyces tritici]
MLVVTLVGCASGSGSIDRQAAEAVLLANNNADTAIEEALDRVARVCMEEQGFELHPPELEFEVDQDMKAWLGQSVLTKPDLSLPPVEIYGIGLESGVDTTFVEIEDDGDISYLEEPSEFDQQSIADQEAYFAAFYGSSEMTPETINLPELGEVERAGGGCLRRAEDTLADGNYPDFLVHAGLAGARGGTDWEQDERVFDARIEWSICMEAAGFEYDEPFSIYMDLGMQVGGYQQSAIQAGDAERQALEKEFDEIILSVAAVDAVCHEETGLEGIQSDVYWEYMIEYVSANEEEFFAFKERTDEMLSLAQDIIAAGRLPS